MKKWILIEWKNGDEFETCLQATTREEALTEAQAVWKRLSGYDQKNREEFFVVFAELNEDGSVDFDTESDHISKEEISGKE